MVKNKKSGAKPRKRGRGKARALFLSLHRSGKSVGMYLPVPLRIALGVKEGDHMLVVLGIHHGNGLPMAWIQRADAEAA